MSSKDKNEKENGKTLMSSKNDDENEKDENKNAKNKKTSTKKATNKKKDENENMLLEYMEDIDDKLFQEYSNSKKF